MSFAKNPGCSGVLECRLEKVRALRRRAKVPPRLQNLRATWDRTIESRPMMEALPGEAGEKISTVLGPFSPSGQACGGAIAAVTETGAAWVLRSRSRWIALRIRSASSRSSWSSRVTVSAFFIAKSNLASFSAT